MQRIRAFFKQNLSIKDRVICVYQGEIISRKTAYAKTQKSNYIVEVADHYDLPLCIDGWDNTSSVCYNKGGYANDAIDWEGANGKWNAEFIIDDYDNRKTILRPLRDIAPGEQTRNKVSLPAAARYTQEQYIFQYEVILISIWIGQH